jgi:hypothetical protein
MGYELEYAAKLGFWRLFLSSENRMHVDIFVFAVEEGTAKLTGIFEGYVDTCWFPAALIHPVVFLPFHGRMLPVPSDPRGRCDAKFGAEWQTVALRSWYSDDDAAVPTCGPKFTMQPADYGHALA